MVVKMGLPRSRRDGVFPPGSLKWLGTLMSYNYFMTAAKHLLLMISPKDNDFAKSTGLKQHSFA